MIKNKQYDKKANFVDDIFAFYGIPILSQFSLISIITGESKWGPYKECLNHIQVRLIGLFALLICIIITYNVLIKWPKECGGTQKVKVVMKEFFTSIFLLVWILLIIVSFIYEIYKSFYLKILYFIMLGICFYFQREFIKTEKRILDL